MLEKKYKVFLDELREKGTVNMFGAGPYIRNRFGVSNNESFRILSQWMNEFKKDELNRRQKSAVKYNSILKTRQKNISGKGEHKIKTLLVIIIALLSSTIVYAQFPNVPEPPKNITIETEYRDKDGKYLGRCTIKQTETICYDKNGKISFRIIEKKR